MKRYKKVCSVKFGFKALSLSRQQRRIEERGIRFRQLPLKERNKT